MRCWNEADLLHVIKMLDRLHSGMNMAQATPAPMQHKSDISNGRIQLCALPVACIGIQ